MNRRCVYCRREATTFIGRVPVCDECRDEHNNTSACSGGFCTIATPPTMKAKDVPPVHGADRKNP